MNRVTIYSRNIFGVPFFANQHKIRIDRLLEESKLARSDILLLQEVFLPKDKREIRKCFKKEFHIFQAKNGFLRFGGGLCGLFKKRTKIESHHFIPFNSSGFLSNLTITDKIAGKGFQVFKISRPIEITLINTHLTCPYIKNIDESYKIKNLMANQLSSIKKYVDKETKNPLIICGDFNLEITQDIMKDFITDAGLDNHTSHLHNTVLENFYSPKWLFQSFATTIKKPDYVLTKNFPKNWETTIKRASDHHELISDHVGIITTIDF